MGPGDLRDILSGLSKRADGRVLVDMGLSDDAGVVRLDRDRGLIHTIDVITPIVDDPETFGRVAAANAVSDVYAMGGEPLSAVSLVALPKGLPARAVGDILKGAQDVLDRCGAFLVGGHTVKDAELKVGFAVTGLVDPRKMTTNQGARPGDRLLLTKALGTGVLYQAMKAERRTAAETRALVANMVALNQRAAQRMVEVGVRCATDVTGFGLVGHALNVARGSKVDMVLDASQIPALPGVEGYLAEGIFPGTTNANLKGYGRGLVVGKGVPEAAVRLAADPQTSGGLLIAVTPRKAAALKDALGAWEVGEVRKPRGKAPAVRLVASLGPGTP
ncbi:MAG: selenide, water dikinase SelD [Deltaproteobacteria bacterium]|nr:selenide, water dikinase SelD [Deltaproteobacteria bacterium]